MYSKDMRSWHQEWTIVNLNSGIKLVKASYTESARWATQIDPSHGGTAAPCTC